MGGRIVIVGTGRWASAAYECFRYDSACEVSAFSVEAKYIDAGKYRGLPLVPLQDIRITYPPESYLTFVAVSPSPGSSRRKRLYDMVTAAGYAGASYVSSRAFALRNVQIGRNAFVQEYAALQHMTRIGNNVFVENGACVGHSSVIEDDCFIGPHAVIAGFARIGRGSFLGANSCVADTVRVAHGCTLRAGAVVLKDTRPGQVYAGNPARPVDTG